MNQSEAIQLWAMLGAEGKAPTELTHASHVLPSYSVGIEPWIDRLAQCTSGTFAATPRTSSWSWRHTGEARHTSCSPSAFVLASRKTSLSPTFRAAKGSVLDNPLDVYREFVKHLQLPGQDQPGLRVFLDATTRAKQDNIRQRGVPDVDAAFRLRVSDIRRRNYPENAFGRVMAAALQAIERRCRLAGRRRRPPLVAGGRRHAWAKPKCRKLHLARVPAASRRQFGRNLLLSLVKFLPEAGVHGLLLLMDEVETLFQVRKGAAALRILGAMRVILDAPTGVSGGVPLFGVFSATPEVLEEFRKYPALEQRLAVRGASFDQGNGLAPQMPLDKVQSQETFLAEIGEKLMGVGAIALVKPFDRELQRINARRLARVASERSLDVDARRLFVKTWVNLLDIQSSEGEREIEEDELMARYSGSFESVDTDPEFEP